MSVSSDAVLFYGYCWEDEEQLFSDDEEWTDRIYRNRGFVDPFDSYHEPESLSYSERSAHYSAWADENRSAMDARYSHLKDIRTEFPCEIGYHGSGEWSVPYIYIVESQTLAYRGGPQVIESLVSQHLWNVKLDEFMDALSIEPPQAVPQWWLASYWG
jgi:hypothetical protein